MGKIMEKVRKIDYEDAFLTGLSDVLAHKQGNVTLKPERVCVPVVKAKEIRASMAISQQEFAEKFGIPLATVKNWEQGRREPDQPTSILLHLISKFPKEIANEIERLRSHH
jgi:putative transcriptional regulator